MTAPQERYYKMTNLNGFDYQTGTIDYARALGTSEVIRHPWSEIIDTEDDSTYLSIATTPGDTFGNGPIFGRLFRVKPVGEIKPIEGPMRRMPQTDNWRAVLALQVVKELPHTEALGPNGAALLEFFRIVRHSPREFFWALAKNYEPLPTGEGLRIRDATYHTGFFTAAMAARFNIGRLSARYAPRAMPVDAKAKAVQAFIDTAWAIVTRSLIPAEYTALLMRTWRKTFGADYA